MTNIVGQRFGKLTVVSFRRFATTQNKKVWNCRCDCGRATTAWTQSLTDARKTSCGCDDPRQHTKLNGRGPLTAERLREVMNYNLDTGEFRWIVALSGRGKVGKRVGTIDAHGHRITSIDGKTYRTARLAWMYVTGVMPIILIDHENTDRADDRWENLRLATHSQNNCNSRKRSKNPYHLKGAFFRKDTGRWFSLIGAGGKTFYLGTFNSREEAHAAYCEAARRLHGEFARAA